MKLIKKNNEPTYLLGHRKKSKSHNYESFCYERTMVRDKDTKEEKEVSLYNLYINYLLDEQGSICAYCMRRIPNKQAYFSGKETKEVREKKDLKLEHWYPQHGERTIPEQTDIMHSNMIAVCTGNKGLAKIKNYQNETRLKAKQVETCDTRREEGDFLVVNPQLEKHIDLIKYSGDGSTFAFEIDEEDQEKNENDIQDLYRELRDKKGIDDNKLDKKGKVVKPYKKLLEIDLKNTDELKLAIHYDLTVTLNLNETDLKLQRESIYRTVSKRTRSILKIKYRNRVERNGYLENEIEKWLSRKDNKFKPFCMVAVFYLKSKIR